MSTVFETKPQAGHNLAEMSHKLDFQKKLQAVLRQSIDAFGKVDILVNCAGIGELLRRPLARHHGGSRGGEVVEGVSELVPRRHRAGDRSRRSRRRRSRRRRTRTA